MKCQYCKETIRKEAIKCKHCGTILLPIASFDENFEKKNSLWLSIVSLVFGIVLLLGVLDNSEQDKDFIEGAFIFATIAFLSGAITLTRKLNGQGMAIAGVILSILALLIAIAK